MLVGPFHGYRLEQLTDTSFLTPEQLELLTAQKPLGMNLAIDPHVFTWAKDREAIAALVQVPGYSFQVNRYTSGEKAGTYVIDAQLFQQAWQGGAGYSPQSSEIEAATIPVLLQRLRDTLLADLVGFLAPLGLTVQAKN